MSRSSIEHQGRLIGTTMVAIVLRMNHPTPHSNGRLNATRRPAHDSSARLVTPMTGRDLTHAPAGGAGACRGQPLLVSPPTRIVVAVSPDAKGVEAAKAAERPSAEITTGA
jgi:hypothetical protein